MMRTQNRSSAGGSIRRRLAVSLCIRLFSLLALAAPCNWKSGLSVLEVSSDAFRAFMLSIIMIYISAGLAALIGERRVLRSDRFSGLILHTRREARREAFFAFGFFPFGVVVETGPQERRLNRVEVDAVVAHEVSHITGGHNVLRFFTVFLFAFLIEQGGVAEILFLWGVFWQTNYVLEILADRSAASRVSAGVLSSALSKLAGRGERLCEFLDLIPVLSVLLCTHPPLSVRMYLAGGCEKTR